MIRTSLLRHMAFLLCIGVTCVDPANAQRAPIEVVALEMRNVDGHASFRLTITDAPDEDLHRRLEIRCIEGCSGEVVYREDNSEFPLGAFRLWDGNQQVVTIWVGGSAYWVRIYRLESRGITKIFEQGSKSAPQFGWTPEGDEFVVLQHRDEEPTNVRVRGIVWKWTGRKYERMKSTR